MWFTKSNILEIINVPTKPKKIRDMEPKEYGYAVSWAYMSGELNENFDIFRDKSGTADMYVECISKGKYCISFHQEPEEVLRRVS